MANPTLILFKTWILLLKNSTLLLCEIADSHVWDFAGSNGLRAVTYRKRVNFMYLDFNAKAWEQNDQNEKR